jgi:T5SS/PEP-CTERM-associated repeat protein/autotransporter-associated beta strand protein
MNAKHCLGRLCILLLVLNAAPSLAQDSWNTLAGAWNVGANWLDLSVPTGAESAVVTNNGTANIVLSGATASTLTVGVGAGQSGVVNVFSGANASFSALIVGAAGCGTYTVAANATTQIFGISGLTIGQSATGQGSLQLSGSASVFTNASGQTLVGQFGDGSLLLDLGATYNGSSSSFFVGAQAGSLGYVYADNGSQINNPGTYIIGGSGTGCFSLSQNSSLTGQYLTVANNTGSDGDFGVINGSTATLSQDITVGYFGTGYVTLSTGGQLYTGGFASSIGRDAAGNGQVNLYDGSTWTHNGTNLYIGESGTGLLRIQSGSTFTGVNGTVGRFTNNGTLEVSDANSTATFSGQVTSQGLIDVKDGGKLTANTVQLFNGGNTTVSGGKGGRGVLETHTVDSQSSTDVLRFEGGIFRARSDQAEVFIGLGEFESGGELITAADGMFVDPNGYAIGTSAVISGDGAVHVDGNGSFELKGNSSYTGGTNVQSGTLIVNNTSGSATGNGTVYVAPGAALSGCGTIGGDLDLYGNLGPGNSIGTLEVEGDVSWADGDWLFELGTSATSLADAASGLSTEDLLLIGGDFLNLGGSNFDFQGTGELGWYQIVDWDGTTDYFSSTFTGGNLTSGYSAAFVISGTALYLEVIPEPSTSLLVATGLLTVLSLRSRRRNA